MVNNSQIGCLRAAVSFFNQKQITKKEYTVNILTENEYKNQYKIPKFYFKLPISSTHNSLLWATIAMTVIEAIEDDDPVVEVTLYTFGNVIRLIGGKKRTKLLTKLCDY